MSTRMVDFVAARARSVGSAKPGFDRAFDRADERLLEVERDQLDLIAGGLRAQGMDYGG